MINLARLINSPGLVAEIPDAEVPGLLLQVAGLLTALSGRAGTLAERNGEATAEGAASRFGLGVLRPRTGAEQPTPPPAQSPLKDRYQTDEWLKPKEAAALLGVSPEFVKRKLRHLGRRLGHKTVRYKKADLERWAARK